MLSFFPYSVRCPNVIKYDRPHTLVTVGESALGYSVGSLEIGIDLEIDLTKGTKARGQWIDFCILQGFRFLGRDS